VSGFDSSPERPPPLRSSIGGGAWSTDPGPDPVGSEAARDPLAARAPLPRPPLPPGADLGPADAAPGPRADAAGTKSADAVAPEADPYLFDLPAPPRPVWLDKLTLLLLTPLVAGGGNPVLVIILAMEAARQVGWIEPWLAIVAGLSLVTVPSCAALALLFHRAASYRRVLVDERGFVFGKTAKWRGTRVAWEQVQGFQIRSDGMMLRLKGKPWTRWLGPIVHTQDRETHELVVALEERGIYRLNDE